MDTPELEGTWAPLQAEFAGERAPALALEKMRLIFSSGNYRVEFDAEAMDIGTYLPRAGAPRPTLDLRGVRGTNAGRHIPALYQLRGDRLRICFGIDGILPESFSGEPEGKYLLTLRRVRGE